MTSDSADRPNDPKKVIYEPARPAIIRSLGGTQSEKYLAQLCDRSFLNLWSYPNTFIDKKSGGKGDGKELCDLLVVCGDHVLIFSDKTVEWPGGSDDQLAWKRWYRRAIQKSVNQIRGAERWITKFPEGIFLDKQCTQRLPLTIPPAPRRKIHGIIVAHGAGEACRQYFGEGIGSLMIMTGIQGDAHWNTEHVMPFCIGDVEPTGSFVHILDDATLNIVMGELDTITDLTAYLSKKEMLIRSKKVIVAGGEEDLVALYMTHMNERGEHDFTNPNGSSLNEFDLVSLPVGYYNSVINNTQYQAKKEADGNSYVWDRLIEAFTTHMLEGTTIFPDDFPVEFSDLERCMRLMAAVPRFKRRSFGTGILDALHRGTKGPRFTRAFLPGPTEPDQETGFFFMTLEIPNYELTGGYEQYRIARRVMLQTYALEFLRDNSNLKQVVGIATEPPSGNRRAGSSEDMIVVQSPEWTTDLLRNLEERKKILNIAQPGNYSKYPIRVSEFPENRQQPLDTSRTNLNRRQRRTKSAKRRKTNRKRN